VNGYEGLVGGGGREGLILSSYKYHSEGTRHPTQTEVYANSAMAATRNCDVIISPYFLLIKSQYLILSHLLSYLLLAHLISFHHTSPYLISLSHLTASHLISPHLVLHILIVISSSPLTAAVLSVGDGDTGDGLLSPEVDRPPCALLPLGVCARGSSPLTVGIPVHRPPRLATPALRGLERLLPKGIVLCTNANHANVSSSFHMYDSLTTTVPLLLHFKPACHYSIMSLHFKGRVP
jgi:hypothetical protein